MIRVEVKKNFWRDKKNVIIRSIEWIEIDLTLSGTVKI